MTKLRLAVALLFLPLLPALAQSPPLFPDSVVTNGSLRNNYTGFLGTNFNLHLTGNFFVFALGRAYFPGNTGTHILKLVSANTGLDVPGSTVQITMSQAGSQPFQYAALPTPILIPTGSYYLLSSETAGGDDWDDIHNVTPAVGYQLFNVPGAVYTDASGAYVVVPNPPGDYGDAYVPPNMLFQPNFGLEISSPIYNQVLTAPNVYNITVQITLPQTQTTPATIQVYVDNTVIANVPITSANTYTIPLDTSTLTPGAHTVFAASTMGEGNQVPITVVAQSVIPLVYSQTPGPVRNNFSGFVGMEFTTPKTSGLTVTSVGRFVASQSSSYAAHLVKIVDETSGLDVPGASAMVTPKASDVGKYDYVALGSAVTLKANWPYYLVSQEVAGGDNWYDVGPVDTNSINIGGPIYQQSNGIYVSVPLPGYSYVPVNLTYTQSAVVPPPATAAFVTGVSPTTLRNDYSGYVGTELTVGSTALQVQSLGRYCAFGNSQSHMVEILSIGSPSTTVSATVNMSGCTTGQYVYVALPSAFTLAAGGSYYLADVENSGGDKWYDYSPITVNGVATVKGSIYSDATGSFVLVPQASTSYVPLNFLYSIGN